MIHSVLVWLENNVRKPYLEGTYTDTYVVSPVKKLYCEWRKVE